MKKQLTITLILFPILLFAQWPTEPFTGLQLTNDPNHYEYIKAYCQDGEGGYYVCIENEGRLYINHIDLNGNIRWPIDYPPEECFTDQDSGWEYVGPKRGYVIMTCNSDGTVWVTWEDYRDSYYDEWGYPTSADIYIQKFNQNRIAQWNPETGMLVQAHVNTSSDPNINDDRLPQHIEAQSDGDVVLIWVDKHQPSVSYYGNEWAQRFGSDGHPIWATPGVNLIPNDIWSEDWASVLYLSDGIGGVLFTYQNIPLRLLPTGELAWEFGAVEIEEIIRPRDICAGYDNTIVIIGDGRSQAGEEDICYATVVDTSGNFVYGPTSIGNPEHTLSGYLIGKIGNSDYGVIDFQEPDLSYYKANEQLTESYNYTIIDTFPRIHSLDKDMTEYGYRALSYQVSALDQPTHNEMWGWDVEGNYLFYHKLEEDSDNVWRPTFDVDPSGNTWVFWTKVTPDDDVYLNVISPEGVWGIASNGVDSPYVSSALPSDISLHVYPNPGNGQFNVSFDLVEPSPATFILTNVLGQRVYSFELPRNAVASGLPGANRSGQINLNLNDQASGTYFLQLRTESGQVQQRKILLVK